MVTAKIYKPGKWVERLPRPNGWLRLHLTEVPNNLFKVCPATTVRYQTQSNVNSKLNLAKIILLESKLAVNVVIISEVIRTRNSYIVMASICQGKRL